MGNCNVGAIASLMNLDEAPVLNNGPPSEKNQPIKALQLFGNEMHEKRFDFRRANWWLI